MQYEVIRFFTDAQDNEHPYNVGDIYPRNGLSVKPERIQNLMNGNNFQRVSLIKPLLDNKAADKSESEQIGREDIIKMPFFKLKSVAKSYGIDVTDLKADDIRAALIEKLEL